TCPLGLPPYPIVWAAACSCIGSPTRAATPALETRTESPKPRRANSATSRRSAWGERQMLPVHTVRMRNGLTEEGVIGCSGVRSALLRRFLRVAVAIAIRAVAVGVGALRRHHREHDAVHLGVDTLERPERALQLATLSTSGSCHHDRARR